MGAQVLGVILTDRPPGLEVNYMYHLRYLRSKLPLVPIFQTSFDKARIPTSLGATISPCTLLAPPPPTTFELTNYLILVIIGFGKKSL